jgi:hypothetical protein
MNYNETTWNDAAFAAFKGATIAKIDNTCPMTNTFMSCLLAIHAADGRILVFGHMQDCCENVDITNWADADGEAVIGAEFLRAEERTDTGFRAWGDSWTATFYELSTSKGALTLSFQGESSGYYSESVDVVLLEPQ